MRKMTVRVLAFACFLCFPLSVWALPGLVVDAQVYQFDSIPEGTHISHTFVVKNRSDTLVHITQVQPP